MKLKLSNSEMLAFKYLVTAICNMYQHTMEESGLEMGDKLTKTIFDRMNLEFMKKGLVRKKFYSINLKPEFALVFWCVLNEQRFKNDMFMDNLVIKLCNQIHQQYA